MSKRVPSPWSKALPSILAAATAIVLSPPVLAQEAGWLTYGPVSFPIAATAVPVGGGIASLLLALLLAGAAYRVMRRPGSGSGGGSAMSIALTTGSAVLLMSSAAFVYNADAITAAIQLDNPGGGTVGVPEGYQEYVNSSGVAQEVREIVSPCGAYPLPKAAAAAAAANGATLCVAGSTVLQNGNSCATDFMCSEPTAEICDGIDNDRDTFVDEEVVPPGEPCDGEWTCYGSSGWICLNQCVPNCAGLQCGPDGCGGSCGTCGDGSTCNEGVCQVIPPS